MQAPDGRLLSTLVFAAQRCVCGLGMNAMILKSMGPAVHFPCLLDEVREKNPQ